LKSSQKTGILFITDKYIKEKVGCKENAADKGKIT
jgi:hypothetical protein